VHEDVEVGGITPGRAADGDRDRVQISRQMRGEAFVQIAAQTGQ
jgi:hypothetical protein